VKHEEAAEMTGDGQRGKPKAGFPLLPTTLGNRMPDFHIPAAPAHDRHGKVEIQEQDSHFSTAHSLSKPKTRKEINPGPDTLSSGSFLD
jgi:hypothetical protein